MIANGNKSYHPYLNKLEDRRNNACHHCHYSPLTEKVETNHKAPKFEINHRVGIAKYKNIFSKSYTENW